MKEQPSYRWRKLFCTSTIASWLLRSSIHSVSHQNLWVHTPWTPLSGHTASLLQTLSCLMAFPYAIVSAWNVVCLLLTWLPPAYSWEFTFNVFSIKWPFLTMHRSFRSLCSLAPFLCLITLSRTCNFIFVFASYITYTRFLFPEPFLFAKYAFYWYILIDILTG